MIEVESIFMGDTPSASVPESNVDDPDSQTPSLRTIRPRPRPSVSGAQTYLSGHATRDLSLWHERCKPFLLQAIQQRTEKDVQALIACPSDLKQFLRDRVTERDASSDLSFLELVPPEVSSFFMADTLSISRSSITSTGSQASATSLSSQVSDSVLNDVQQSADALLKSLRVGSQQMEIVEKKHRLRDKEKHRFIDEIRRLFGKEKPATPLTPLKGAMDGITTVIRRYQPEMHTIGFPDVGLKLNSCEQAFRGAVLGFFRAAEKEKRLKKSVKASKRTGEETDWWKNHVLSLAKTTKDLADAIVDALDDAMKTRGQYLIAAYEEMDWVAHVCAEANGLQVQDGYHGLLLVQRTYTCPESDMQVSGAPFSGLEQTFVQ